MCNFTAQNLSNVIVTSKDYVKILRSKLRELAFYINWNEVIEAYLAENFKMFSLGLLEKVFLFKDIVNIRNKCLFFCVHGKWTWVRQWQIFREPLPRPSSPLHYIKTTPHLLCYIWLLQHVVACLSSSHFVSMRTQYPPTLHTDHASPVVLYLTVAACCRLFKLLPLCLYEDTVSPYITYRPRLTCCAISDCCSMLSPV